MRFQKLIQKFCHWQTTHYTKILWIALVIALFGTYYSAQLYKNLRADIEELLPESAASVQDLKKATDRIAGVNLLITVIESNDVEAAKRFQIDLTKRLKQLPDDLISKVKNNIQVERQFFEKHKSLYIDLKDWQDILKYVHEQKASAKKKVFNIGLEDDQPQTTSTFDFAKLREKYAGRKSSFAGFHDDYFQSPDGKIRIVLSVLPGKVTNIRDSQRLSQATQKIINELDPKKYASDMRVGLSGDVQNMVEEHHGLVSDLVTSFFIVIILVTLVLWLYYKSFGAVVTLIFSLFAGVLTTFGISYFIVGYLNANTAFLGSIVIGNGINFGIILLARYIEDRKKAIPLEAALPHALIYTCRATFTAAAAAGVAYGSLVITHFRGFNQFGIIGALGMIFCWISAFTLMPALIIWFEKHQWINYRYTDDSVAFMRKAAKFVAQHYPTIAIVSTLFTAVALFGALPLVKKNSLESDLSKLRNKESIMHGSGFWGAKNDQVFGRTLTPTLVLTNSAEDTDKLYQELKAIHIREGEQSPFSYFHIINDYVPDQQIEKLKIMSEIHKELTPKIIKKLKPDDRRLVTELLPTPLPSPIAAKDLPPDLLTNFREANGRLYTTIHVYPFLSLPEQKSAQGTWNGDSVIRYTKLLREAITTAKVPAIIAGQPPISADLLTAIVLDAPKATFWALFAVMILVIIMFPQWRQFCTILFSLGLGVLWMTGIMGYMSWKINFLNFITLPITFGIGVDYAVNIFGRMQEERKAGREQGIVSAINQTGGAVILCSMTTIIGYSSLLLSGSQAFVSFGRLAVLGEVTCIIAAIITLPAFWLLREKQKQESIKEKMKPKLHVNYQPRQPSDNVYKLD